MAFTKIKELTGYDTGPGGTVGENPVFWPEDVYFLLSQEDSNQLLEVNIIFQGLNLTGMVGKADAGNDPEAIVLIQCPPYRQQLVQKYASDEPPVV